MLGNFSFGDYFKNEAIHWTWEFLTEVVGLDPNRLYPSIYQDDDEAFEIWNKEIGIPEERIFRFGKEDNFWEHGAGPCGPCSEVYYDRGEKYGCGEPGCTVGCECDRYMEIWNNVFTQFDNDGHGNYTQLKTKNIDTGMGLERLACVMQDVDNLFEVDTVQNILKKISSIVGVDYKADPVKDISLRVITDHIRSTVMMICDGVLPSNEGRGYVLRRLLRRAARHGRLLGCTKPFLHEVCDTVINENLSAYPELDEKRAYIKKVIQTEEESFAKTIDKGTEILNEMIEKLQSSGEKVLPGADVFKLHDTYGFPLDLTKEILHENGLEADEEGFQECMKVQKDTARKNKKLGGGWDNAKNSALDAYKTTFVGYAELEKQTKLLAIVKNGEVSELCEEGDDVSVVLEETPFYAEMGGQVGDCGTVVSGDNVIEIANTQKLTNGAFISNGKVVSGGFAAGETVTAKVDAEKRAATQRNHTCAHILQAALRHVLGDHVHQAGSYVDPYQCRFDFSHFSAVTPEELAKVEEYVNNVIMEAVPVVTEELPIEEAKKKGAMALFGEKYGKVVRVVDIEGWSTEFCGGTHVKNTAQIGGFKIVSESSVAAGIRRIEAVTGRNLLIRANLQEAMLHDVANTLKANNVATLPARAEAVMAENKAMSRELEEMKAKIAASKVDSLFDNAEEADGVKIASAYFTGTSGDTLRGMCDSIRDKAVNPCVAVLVGKTDDKITMAVTVNKLAQEKGLKAGNLVKEISAIAGGKGGGKPDFAMAGLKDETKIDEALAAVKSIVEKQLG